MRIPPFLTTSNPNKVRGIALQIFNMADKVKEVAIEEAERIKSQTIQAARSAAYLYPLRVSISRTTAQCCLLKFVC
jgi:hypothetical protein